MGLLPLCSLLYLQCHHMLRLDRRLWYHCPSLPEGTAGWHILAQTYPYSVRQCHPLLALQSHGPLFGMFEGEKYRDSVYPNWQQCSFPFSQMEMISSRILGLQMMGHNVARQDNPSINLTQIKAIPISWLQCKLMQLLNKKMTCSSQPRDQRKSWILNDEF